ncbi:flavin-nucleotide-binding protein [Zymoseptoria brevis]|uniref:Flavin-nucleotide-binding protein n=1 Tax=Zymoseptoria brevis TaxID=1047168 RepID=A0A0F4GSY5_9PEZI|nr:flavin-nucleotide-binding protein [Zymoseptoria brevis]
MATYIPDARSKGVRLAKRTQYDQDLVHGIINETPILHVSFNAPPKDGPQFPTILPMLGSIDTYPGDEEAHVYLHGSSVARLFRLTQGDEVPLCIAGTILDGYVLALAPFHNSCNYRSAVVFGHGSMLEDDAEVQFALRSITNRANPSRWENSRSPPTKSELTSTGVLKVRIETASAKTRTGGPSDEKADLQNAEVVNNTWIGVVPTYLTLGEPVAGDENKVKKVPEYLADWVADANSINEQKAIDAIDR